MVAATIRQIQASEGAALREIRLRAIADSPRAFAVSLAETLAQPDASWAAWAAVAARGASRILYVAEHDGRWVGIVGGMLETEQTENVAELIALWVDPAHRGQGLGRALIEQVIAWAQRQAAGRLALWVTQGNTAALELYGRCGFHMTPQRMPLPPFPDQMLQKMVLPLCLLPERGSSAGPGDEPPEEKG